MISILTSTTLLTERFKKLAYEEDIKISKMLKLFIYHINLKLRQSQKKSKLEFFCLIRKNLLVRDFSTFNLQEFL